MVEGTARDGLFHGFGILEFGAGILVPEAEPAI